MLGDILPATSGRHLSGAVAQPAQGTPPGSRAAHGCCQGSHDTWLSVLTPPGPLGRAPVTGHLVTAPSPLAPFCVVPAGRGSPPSHPCVPMASPWVLGLPAPPQTLKALPTLHSVLFPGLPLSFMPLVTSICLCAALKPPPPRAAIPGPLPQQPPPLPWLVLTQAIPSIHDSRSGISAQVPANCSHLPWGGARGPQFQELMADPTCLPQGSAPCSRLHSLPSNRRPILHPLTRHAALWACHTPVPTSRGSRQHKQHCSPSAKNSPVVALLSG